MCGIITGMSCAGQSKNTPVTDTLCFDVPTIQKLLIAAEQKKVLEDQLAIVNERIVGLEARIAIYKDKDTFTVASFQREISNYKEQKIILLETVAGLNKQLIRERRKRFWTAAGGIAATGIAAFFYITK